MPAKDIFHNTVKIALEKDKWTITDENLFIQIEDIDFYIDLTAEKILAAEKTGKKIAVEIKSFLGPSDVTEFHLALGQCLNYRSALRLTEPDRILYLAIPVDVYHEFFSRQFIQRIISEYQLKLLIFNPDQEDVVLWKD
ncbi:XisH family protein [Roseofilum reptotaenium CS-1145]|uniref:Fatty-acid oxidation protein subunit alpha n=1 Tax=Roseofilum reptotaenium AO1-A TaxID=1925591 RepID=A0A1L9QQG6_9CYAN|nr:XisH family protein [Roseofilum reptotaenium]MDB9516210.1 XisH family protein [Roseofilum reptotaenium CS-1145]OJJ24938.1 fatty-acid oxidation protein subunit alpha [Roseofilum reptotaenium AO1-A]